MRGVRYKKVAARPNIDPNARYRAMASPVGRIVPKDGVVGGPGMGEEKVRVVELKRRKVDKKMIGNPTDFR